LTPTLSPSDAAVLSYGYAVSLLNDSTKLKRFLDQIRKGTAVAASFGKAFGIKLTDHADAWLTKRSPRRRSR
jgi:hypothetical protein